MTERSRIADAPVIHLLNSSEYSGAENVAMTAMRAVEGNFSTIYASRPGGIREVVESEGQHYVPVQDLSRHSIRRLEDENVPSIVHAHDWTASLACALHLRRTPFIMHLHSNPPWLKTAGTKSFGFLFSATKAATILTVSQAVIDEFIFRRMIAKKVGVLSNPLDKARIQTLANEAVPSTPHDLVFVGRLAPAKDPTRFIRIVAEVAKENPGVSAAVVGDGPLMTDLVATVEKYKLQRNLRIYGRLRNPFGILAASRIICVPSIFEGFGMVAAEALSLGVPAVTSGVGGLADVVDHKSGFACRTDAEYARRILELLSNSGLYTAMSQNAVKRSEEFLSIERYGSRLGELYGDVLSRGRR